MEIRASDLMAGKKITFELIDENFPKEYHGQYVLFWDKKTRQYIIASKKNPKTILDKGRNLFGMVTHLNFYSQQFNTAVEDKSAYANYVGGVVNWTAKKIRGGK